MGECPGSPLILSKLTGKDILKLEDLLSEELRANLNIAIKFLQTI